MGRHLVIVESPAKARTLGRYLGRDYTVRASMGHVRDLPRSRLGVDVARGFAVEYDVLPSRRRVLAELKAAAREAEAVYLAADPDREGEAICWHLAEELAGRGMPGRFRRVAFHEITRRAVEEAFRSPRSIDRKRVDAQQARRVLDRLVGYRVSPFLWARVRPGLSAGRVQSVALRLVCDRERAILAFTPAEYWVVRAHLRAAGPPVFVATLAEVDGEQARVGTAAEAAAIRADLEAAEFQVAAVVERQRRRPPAPPFVTSTLQQEAFRKLRFGVGKTMRLAQQLYEGVEIGTLGPTGLITYMRTDSTRIAPEAGAAAREHVTRAFGAEFLPEKPPVHRSRRGAQEAHEAIRPTDVERTPDSVARFLGRDALALYTLVWSRFVASQMAPAVYDETRVDVRARPPARPGRPVDYLLRARGATLRFRGFLAVHEESREEGPATSKEAGEALREPAADGREDGGPLPPLERGEELERVKVDTEQRFTEPPSRFSEASLVKELERNGIGRPSTYAAILETLASRDYVERHEGRLRPTRLGFVVADLLIAKFPDLMDVSYTASMEEGLDGIEEGRESLLDVLTRFWRRLERELEAAGRRASSTAPGPAAAMEHSRNAEEAVPAREAEAALGACPRCASPLTRRQGRYGPFVGCSRYPACRHVQKKEATRVGLVCPACHQGEAVEREGPQGRRFYGCSRYPACRFTSHHRPVPESCPECGRPYLLVRDTKRDGRLVFCGNEACHYHRTA